VFEGNRTFLRNTTLCRDPYPDNPLGPFHSVAAIAMAAGLAGCAPHLKQPSETAEAFLKESLTRYQSLASLKAMCLWHAGFGPATYDSKRLLEFSGPNHYHVESTHDQHALADVGLRRHAGDEFSNVPGMVQPSIRRLPHSTRRTRLRWSTRWTAALHLHILRRT